MPRELLASSDIRVRISSDHASGFFVFGGWKPEPMKFNGFLNLQQKTRITTSTYKQDEVVWMNLHTEKKHEKSTSRNNLLNKNILQKQWIMIIIIMITSCSSVLQSSWLHTTVPCQTLYESQSKDFYNPQPSHITPLHIPRSVAHNESPHDQSKNIAIWNPQRCPIKKPHAFCWRKNVLTDGR